MFPLRDSTQLRQGQSNAKASVASSSARKSSSSATATISSSTIQPSTVNCCAAARALRWSKALALPQNAEAFQTLYSRRSDDKLIDVALKDLEMDMLHSARDKRAVRRLYSSLITMEPLLGALPFVAYMCAAIVRAIPSTPLVAHEIAVHMLLNILQDWCTEAPQPPTAQLAWTDDFFKQLEEERRAHRQYLDMRTHLATVPTTAASRRSPTGTTAATSNRSPTNSYEKRAFLDDDEEDCCEDDNILPPGPNQGGGVKMSAAGQRLASRHHEAMLRENEHIAKELARAKVQQQGSGSGMSSRKSSSEEVGSATNSSVGAPCSPITPTPTTTTSHNTNDVSLWEHLNFGCGATYLDYMWLPLQTFFLYSIPSADSSSEESGARNNNTASTTTTTTTVSQSKEWLELVEQIIVPPQTATYSSPMEFFSRAPTPRDLAALTAESLQNMCALSIAVISANRTSLLKCKNRMEVQSVVTSASARLAPGVISRRYAVVSKALSKALAGGQGFTVSGPRWRAPTFIPQRQLYYPLLRIGDHSKAVGVVEAMERHNRFMSNPLFKDHHQVPEVYKQHAARTKDLDTIQGEETDIYRQLKNELDALSASCTVAEFHGYNVHGATSAKPTGKQGIDVANLGVDASMPSRGATPVHAEWGPHTGQYWGGTAPQPDTNTNTSQRRSSNGNTMSGAGGGGMVPPSIERDISAETSQQRVGRTLNEEEYSSDPSMGVSAVTSIARHGGARVEGDTAGRRRMSDASTTTGMSSIPDDIIEAASLLVRASTGRLVARSSCGEESIDRDGTPSEPAHSEHRAPTPPTAVSAAMPPLHPDTATVAPESPQRGAARPISAVDRLSSVQGRTTGSAHNSSIGPSTSADGGRTDGASRSSAHPSVKYNPSSH